MNINVGIIGHVDSGKTALARMLSTQQSTAGFDKHPESQRRGITLDVGFSKFDFDKYQITLVDCPGHAQFVRSVLAGLRIVDFIALVIDGERMFQQQTYESLILMELFNVPSIICLNKCDKLNEETQQKNMKQIELFMSKTKVQTSIVVKTSALQLEGVEEMKKGLLQMCEQFSEQLLQNRNINQNKQFIAQYDHQFNIQGVGVVLTSTILQGSIKINDHIYIQNQNDSSQIKQLQVFKQPVQTAGSGSRVGICVKNVDQQLLTERGLIVCQKQQLEESNNCLVKIKLSRHFKHNIKQGSQYDINFGHETLHCRITILNDQNKDQIDYQNSLINDQKIIISNRKNIDDLNAKQDYFAIIQFIQSVQFLLNSKFILLKLDQQDKKQSRIVLTGEVLKSVNDQQLSTIKYYQNQKYLIEITKINMNQKEMVAKQIVVNNQEIDMLNKDIIVLANNVESNQQEECIIGVVTNKFGQNKWKIQLNELFIDLQSKQQVTEKNDYYLRFTIEKDWQWQ